jgi:hypothetical protein
VILSVANVVAPRPSLTTATAALETVFYLYAAGSLIAYMLQDWHVQTDEIFAAGATFTLLAWGFAYAFVVCQALVPGTFGHADDIPGPRTWRELLYLSVAVLSSVGLSDIYPVRPMGRALVMLESIVGIMYIALVVSRLIGMSTIARRANPD